MLITFDVDLSPDDRAGSDRGAEGGVLGAGPRQDGHEPAAVLVEVGHVLGGGELAVGNVEEVGGAREFPEEVPGLAVRAVVGGVAALDPELHRHGAVACHCENIKQLFQVGPVVLVVAPGDGGSELAAEGAFLRGGVVIAVEGDGGGIVVKLVECDVELADGVRGDVECERRDVGVEEPVEGAADAVVIERGELVFGEPEPRGFVPRGPLADAVEGSRATSRFFASKSSAVVLEMRQRRSSRGSRWRSASPMRSLRRKRSRIGKAPTLRELSVRPSAWALSPALCL